MSREALSLQPYWEHLVTDLATRNPALYRRAQACAQRRGQSVSAFVREAYEEVLAQYEPSPREEYFERLDRAGCPCGLAPLRKEGDRC